MELLKKLKEMSGPDVPRNPTSYPRSIVIDPYGNMQKKSEKELEEESVLQKWLRQLREIQTPLGPEAEFQPDIVQGAPGVSVRFPF